MPCPKEAADKSDAFTGSYSGDQVVLGATTSSQHWMLRYWRDGVPCWRDTAGNHPVERLPGIFWARSLSKKMVALASTRPVGRQKTAPTPTPGPGPPSTTTAKVPAPNRSPAAHIQHAPSSTRQPQVWGSALWASPACQVPVSDNELAVVVGAPTARSFIPSRGFFFFYKPAPPLKRTLGSDGPAHQHYQCRRPHNTSTRSRIVSPGPWDARRLTQGTSSRLWLDDWAGNDGRVVHINLAWPARLA